APGCVIGAPFSGGPPPPGAPGPRATREGVIPPAAITDRAKRRSTCTKARHPAGLLVSRSSAARSDQRRISARSAPGSHVDKRAGDRSRRRHRGRDQVGAALVALAALEIAVRRRGTALARLEFVGIHRKAHRAARLAPFEARLDED